MSHSAALSASLILVSHILQGKTIFNLKKHTFSINKEIVLYISGIL